MIFLENFLQYIGINYCVRKRKIRLFAAVYFRIDHAVQHSYFDILLLKLSTECSLRLAHIYSIMKRIKNNIFIAFCHNIIYK